jgi:hypothetical protein
MHKPWLFCNDIGVGNCLRHTVSLALAITRATCVALHRPLRAAEMPRRFNSSASARSDTVPAARISSSTGPSLPPANPPSPRAPERPAAPGIKDT